MKARKTKQIYERDGTIRAGWRRFTTYYQNDMVNFLKTYADNNNVFVMDLINDILEKWRRTKERTVSKARRSD